ncbi:MAG: hypothetical protein AAF354_14190, partial [Pseudomonadota bacterium]
FAGHLILVKHWSLHPAQAGRPVHVAAQVVLRRLVRDPLRQLLPCLGLGPFVLLCLTSLRHTPLIGVRVLPDTFHGSVRVLLHGGANLEQDLPGRLAVGTEEVVLSVVWRDEEVTEDPVDLAGYFAL